MNQAIPLSLYIHIPWCVKKCPYCDFNSHTLNNTLPESEYLSCLLEDLQHDLVYVQNRSLKSIFFGGGTPSLISPAGIGDLLNKIQNFLRFDPNMEITLETNPGTVEHHNLADYVQAGINRFSVGAQTFNNNLLHTLGRIHKSDDTKRVLHTLQELPLRSYNIDIMHSLPGQTIMQALDDLKAAISFNTPHLSWYQLTIEANTVFHKYPPILPDDETSWQIYTEGLAMLKDAGLMQYEISAYAKSNHQCRHNLNYWNFGDYLGIGAGAHAKITDLNSKTITRSWKTRNPKDYMQRKGNLEQKYLAGSQQVSAADLPGEFMLNQLRLNAPFTLHDFSNRTGLPVTHIDGILKNAKHKQLLAENDGFIQTTALGRRFLNDLQHMFL